MPISEKTVELNVSRTVIEKCRRFHQIQAYAVGATQAQEAKFGFDVEVTDGAWAGGFIQYKKLYKSASGIKKWNLNRTSNRDQHSLLLMLEASGIPVFYCLPDFDTESELRQWTPPPLWTQVWWVKPSSIAVPAPIDEHHHVTLDPSGVWKVFSENGEEFDPGDTSFDAVEQAWFRDKNRDVSLKSIKQLVNKEVDRRWRAIEDMRTGLVSQESRRSDGTIRPNRAQARYMGNLLQGLGLIAYMREI